MNKNYVKKSVFAYLTALVFLTAFCGRGFFCLADNTNEVSLDDTKKDQTTTTTTTTLPTTPEPDPTNKPANIEPTPAKPSPSPPTQPATAPTPTSPASTPLTSQPQPPALIAPSTDKPKLPKPTGGLPASSLTAMENSWGRFAPSSWRRVQTTVWTTNAGHRISNVSETKTVLDSVDDESVTLLETITAGTTTEKTETKPVKKYFDFYNIALNDNTKIINETPMKLALNGRIVPCERRTYEQITPTVTRKITVWYSTQVYPYVMRIERTIKNVPTATESEAKVLSQSTYEVTDSSALRLLTSKQGTYRTRIIKRSGDVTSVTESYCSLHVPGGQVRESTREFDGQGNEIRFVEIRLLNYYFVSLPPPIIIPSTTTIVPNQPLIIQYEPVRPRSLRSYRLRAIPYQYYTD
ncbi:MAG: hypothetical protein LBL39_00650 [Planctomycetaceae bacterium]|jgi:hypothetical protein|nr:hypothetical protein [Planctomycetaceae bacterium]